MVASAEAPSWYPQEDFVLQGTIDRINILERSLVISDSSLVFASKVKVHSLTQEFYPLSKLKVGDVVGANAIDTPGGIRQVVEIWLLQAPNSSGTPASQTISDQQLRKQDRVSSKVRK